MAEVRVQIKQKQACEDIPLPKYMSEGASGMDVCAAVEHDVTLNPGDVRLIPTGLFVAVQPGFEIQVRPRSGLALKHGVTIVNSPGTIDSDYRGEVGVILGNMGREPFVVERGLNRRPTRSCRNAQHPSANNPTPTRNRLRNVCDSMRNMGATRAVIANKQITAPRYPEYSPRRIMGRG